MSISKDPVRLLEEWMRTVDDYFKSCVELQQLACLGNCEEFEKAASEARELRFVASNARRRYKSNRRRPASITGGTYLNNSVAWPSKRRLTTSARKSTQGFTKTARP